MNHILEEPVWTALLGSDSLFLYSVLEAVVSPLDDGNGARARARG